MADISHDNQTDTNQRAVPSPNRTGEQNTVAKRKINGGTNPERTPEQEEHRRRLAALEHEFDDRGDGVMSDYDRERSLPLERYRAAIQAAKSDYREIRSAVDSQFRLIREASDEEYAAFRKTVKGDHEAAVKKLQAAHRDVMAIARKEYQSRVEAARQEYVMERKKIVDDYEGNLDQAKPPLAVNQNRDDDEGDGESADGNGNEPVAIARAEAKRRLMDDPVWLRFCDAAEAVYNEARDFFVKKG